MDVKKIEDDIDIASKKYERIINEIAFSKESFAGILIKDLKNDLASAVLYSMIEIVAASRQVLFYITEEDSKKGYAWIGSNTRRLDDNYVDEASHDEEILTLSIENEKIKVFGTDKEIEYKQSDIDFIAKVLYDIEEKDLARLEEENE